jgi:hypothetical protein
MGPNFYPRGKAPAYDPLCPKTVAEATQGIQQVGNELLLVVVVYFLTHRHKH